MSFDFMFFYPSRKPVPDPLGRNHVRRFIGTTRNDATPPGRTRPLARLGFTLIELLVVVAVIGVLIGLLLPAVQAARESARRVTCSNRVKQFGLAIHNYHDAFRLLPRAWWLETPPDTFNGKPWAVTLLPFLEQQPLFDRFDHCRPPVDQLSPANVAVVQSPIADFVCPSTPGDNELRRYTFNATPAGLPFTATQIAACDYSPSTGVSGRYAQHAYGSELPHAREGALQAVSAAFSDGHDGNFAGILDGLSNTFFLGERTGGPTVYSGGRVDPVATANLIGLEGGGWGDLLGGEHWLRGSLHDGLHWPPREGPCAINCTNARGFGFYSFHPGGAEFLTADGAVHFLNPSIDPLVFASQITRRGRESVSP